MEPIKKTDNVQNDQSKQEIAEAKSKSDTNKDNKDNLNTENKEVAKAEKEIAKDVSKIEEKVEKHKITQKQADKKIKQEIKQEIQELKPEVKNEVKEEVKTPAGVPSDTLNGTREGKVKPKIIPKKSKKTEAIVNAKSVPISTKHSIAVCNFIRGKDIDTSIILLEQVEKMKRAIPLRGEIPHRKGKGMMSGRYLTNAVKNFIKLLKSLKSNALVNELELEKYKIFCKANLASRPYRRFGKGKFKRTHITLKLIPRIKKLPVQKALVGENK